MEQKMKRYNPDINKGLNNEQVNERIEENLVNYDSSVPTKSIKQIIFENFFTLFNFLNLFLGIAIFCVGSYKNMLFLGIIIINNTKLCPLLLSIINNSLYLYYKGIIKYSI